MKHRILKNLYTTIIGMIIMMAGVGLYLVSVWTSKFEFTQMNMVFLLVLGWVFLMAKNSLIQGVFLNLFKVTNPKE